MVHGVELGTDWPWGWTGKLKSPCMQSVCMDGSTHLAPHASTTLGRRGDSVQGTVPSFLRACYPTPISECKVREGFDGAIWESSYLSHRNPISIPVLGHTPEALGSSTKTYHGFQHIKGLFDHAARVPELSRRAALPP